MLATTTATICSCEMVVKLNPIRITMGDGGQGGRGITQPCDGPRGDVGIVDCRANVVEVAG